MNVQKKIPNKAKKKEKVNDTLHYKLLIIWIYLNKKKILLLNKREKIKEKERISFFKKIKKYDELNSYFNGKSIKSWIKYYLCTFYLVFRCRYESLIQDSCDLISFFPFWYYLYKDFY